MCLGTIPDESCGWPKGTVRSTLSLIIIITGLASMSTLMILLFTKDQYEAAIGVAGTIAGFVGLVIGYYFGSKSAEGAAKMISNVETQIMERNRELEAGNMARYEAVRSERDSLLTPNTVTL